MSTQTYTEAIVMHDETGEELVTFPAGDAPMPVEGDFIQVGQMTTKPSHHTTVPKSEPETTELTDSFEVLCRDIAYSIEKVQPEEGETLTRVNTQVLIRVLPVDEVEQDDP